MTTNSQFKDAIQAAGLSPPLSIRADGKIHRFSSNGNRNDDSGWYVLHGDGIPAGAFGCWRTGFTQTWCADIGRVLTAQEGKDQRILSAAMLKSAQADRDGKRASAADKAKRNWEIATDDPAAHEYLARKRIRPHGIRAQGIALVIPMRDADGALHSLQTIRPDGNKKFLSGGRVTGCFHLIGDVDGRALCIAEGYATAATIHEATGDSVAVAFNAANLEPVARALRAKYPDAPLVVCADDDCWTEGNPGLAKARATARAVGASLAVPEFGSERPDGATDFNDMAAHRGLAAVTECLRLVTSKAATKDLTDMRASNDPDLGALACGEPARADVPSTSERVDQQTETQATPESEVPSDDERPCYRTFDSWVQRSGGSKLRPGVWYFGIKEGNESHPPTLSQQWICSPLHIVAVTFDGQDNNFGRLLRFKNTLGRWREWAMPMELLRATGDDLRGELLAMGVEIDPHARTLLGQYLQSKAPKRRVHCALQVGWCGESFVLPDTVIGSNAADVIFQSGERGYEEHTRGGTLQGWQNEIAARAAGNPLLLLALSASFAGPLLGRCNAEGGGLHYVGDSSTGKTTAIEAACATWGGANFRRSWRATANGMEGAAALFNDCLLALDEISECDPREVGQIVYALGNGRGKQRANRTGTARGVTRWRCFVLSSGERTIGTTMTEGGHRAKAGQSVRLLDIPAARRYGAWDELHGLPTGAAFSDALKRAAATNHGHAGRAFLERLTRDPRDFCEQLERIKALPEFAANGGEGQDKRAASRFALVGLAGEVATEYGVTPWIQGAATAAAADIFTAWRALRGKGNDERRQILEAVSGFIERHGDGRFSEAADNDAATTRDRAGWWRDNVPGGRAYLFTAEGLREALKGFDFKRALDILQEVGALPPHDASGERAKVQRIAGRSMRLYEIEPDKLGSELGA